MFKKITLIFCIIFIVQLSSIASGFNPEKDAEFTKMSTLQKWVANKYNENKKLMSKLQELVVKTVPQNPDSKNHVGVCIKNDKNIKQMFGKTFPTIAAIELPFLQHVNNISKNKKVYTLEIAAGNGDVSWKVPFAYNDEGIHYVNELSSHMLKYGIINYNIKKVKQELLSSIRKVHGDCFKLLSLKPELENKFDVIYVQHFEHFLNPVKHQEFLRLLWDLLAPGGRAYLCAHSFIFKDDVKHPVYKLYSEQKKKKEPYPGFVRFRMAFKQIEGTQLLCEIKIHSAERPNKDAGVDTKNISQSREGPYSLKNMILNGQSHNFGIRYLQVGEQEIVCNSFSPSIYRGAVEIFNKTHLKKKFKVIDAFFIDFLGDRQVKWGGTIKHAAAIIEKCKKDKETVKIDVGEGRKDSVDVGSVNERFIISGGINWMVLESKLDAGKPHDIPKDGSGK